uniref:Uncharacterized protein n=1 Tax=Arundo donax TaxID=35708 RepID=A0A0A8ZW81_ARUDO
MELDMIAMYFYFLVMDGEGSM